MIETIANLALFWWGWMSAMSVQLIAVFAVVFLLDRILRRWVWPELLSVLWLVAMLKLVVPPAVTSPVSIANFVPVNAAVSSIAGGSISETPVSILFIVWVAGVIALGTWTTWQYMRTKRNWLGCREATAPRWLVESTAKLRTRLGIGRSVRLSIRDGVTGSAVVGFFKPTVVLPAAFVADRPRREIEHVLMHELAHVKRFDPIASLFCLALQMAYWFHPAVWVARSRLATLREICCDRLVADSLGGQSRQYRDTLLELARPWVMKPRPGHLGLIHRHSQLLHRLEWLERSFSAGVMWRRLATLGLCTLLFVCCVPLAIQPPPPVIASNFESAILPDDPGCMRTRFAVMRALANQEKAGSPVF